jgi:hypothetical protein
MSYRWQKWIIAAACVGLAGYFLLPDHTSRFRLTIELETPDGIKSGSSVIETSAWESGCWGPVEACGVRTSAKGDAIFVDLGHGRNLVALLGFGPSGSDESKIFSLTRAALAPGKDIRWQDESKLRGRGELPEELVPTLVTFSDLNDPKSASVVKPGDIEKTFGPGFKFRRAILETTNDRIGRGIDQKLPWWSIPGRPAALAYHAWTGPNASGPSIYPESLFRKE